MLDVKHRATVASGPEAIEYFQTLMAYRSTQGNN